MKTKFWLWLCRLAYRKIKESHKELPVGLPGHRDPNHICEWYMPRKRTLEDASAECETDGHYLCKDCIWNLHKHNSA